MTEQEWQISVKPGKMIDFLLSRDCCCSERKLRLWGCACCRRIWSLFTDERTQRAVEVCERWVDGRASRGDVEAAFQDACIAYREGENGPKHYPAKAPTYLFSDLGVLIEVAAVARNAVAQVQLPETEGETQSVLLRDVVTPFQSVTVEPAWLTSVVVSLAQGIYEEKAFDRLPILADALQDAGCDNAAIQTHCRSEGPHVRGCWVVDMVLGRE